MRLELEFFDRRPWISVLSFGFQEYPEINMAILPAGVFDAADLPFVNNFISEGVENLVRNLLVHPSKITLPFRKWWYPEAGDVTNIIILH